jgi:hypothetical protein
MKDIKQYIDKVLGSSIRCLLPSYWWKRIFGLIVDEVEDVRKVANNKADKSIITNIQETSQKLEEVSERVEEAVPHILYAPITTLNEEQIAHNAAVLRSLGAINKPYMIEVYYVSGLVLYKVAVNGVTKENNVLTVIASHPLDATSTFAIQMKLQFSADGSCVAGPLRPDAELNAGSLSAVQNKVVTEALATKQDAISDLDAIRSGAAKGATAIQSVKTINGQSIIGEGDITIEADVDTSAFATKEELNALQTEVINNEEVTAAAINDLNTRIGAAADTAYVDNAIASAITLTLNTEV